MYITDPLSDFLARIKNAQQREKETISVPATKMLVAVAQILQEEGFIEKVELIDAKPQKKMELTLKYVDGKPAIQNLKRVSKPGVRQYLGYRDLKRVRQGLGVAIISTPKGVMTGEKAKTEAVGGELLCLVY